MISISFDVYESKSSSELLAIAYAKVKTDKVDARILADLLRTDMVVRVSSVSLYHDSLDCTIFEMI